MNKKTYITPLIDIIASEDIVLQSISGGGNDKGSGITDAKTTTMQFYDDEEYEEEDNYDIYTYDNYNIVSF